MVFSFFSEKYPGFVNPLQKHQADNTQKGLSLRFGSRYGLVAQRDVPSRVGPDLGSTRGPNAWRSLVLMKLLGWLGYTGVSLNGGTQQSWVFLPKNDHFVVFWGYHHLRKHPYRGSGHYMGVSLNGGFSPHFTPQVLIILNRKPHGCWGNPPF